MKRWYVLYCLLLLRVQSLRYIILLQMSQVNDNSFIFKSLQHSLVKFRANIFIMAVKFIRARRYQKQLFLKMQRDVDDTCTSLKRLTCFTQTGCLGTPVGESKSPFLPAKSNSAGNRNPGASSILCLFYFQLASEIQRDYTCHILYIFVFAT